MERNSESDKPHMEEVAERIPPYSSSSREVVDCPTSATSRRSCLDSTRFYASWNMASWTNRSYPPWARWSCPCLHSQDSLRNLRSARRFAVSRFCPVTVRSATLRIIFFSSTPFFFAAKGVEHVTEVTHNN